MAGEATMRGILILAVAFGAAAALAQPAQAPARPWETWTPPVVTLPNPNGFDTYLRAFALKEQLDQKYHVPKPQLTPPPAPEPGPGGPPFPTPAPAGDTWGEGPPDRPVAERVALYADVYRLTRRALTQTCRVPPPKSNDDPNPWYRQFRAMARLFRMEAHAHFEAGQFLAAANSALDCVYMAQDITSEGWVLPWLTGCSCEAIGVRALDETIPKLSAAECRAVLRRLERVEARRLPLAQILAGEMTFQRVALKELMADPGKIREFFQSDGEQPMSDGALRMLHDRFLPVSWERLGEHYDKLLLNAALPYQRRQKNLEPPRDLFVALVAPHAETLFLKDASTRTAALVRQVQLAARWCALEKGHLPATLSDLVPAYLRQVPDDPFGEGPLRSKLDGDTLLIYSIGPDGVDDDGTAILENLKAESKGDIVVRVHPR
jgi:hypothetical protein